MPEIITDVQIVAEDVGEYLMVLWLAVPIEFCLYMGNRYSLVKPKPGHLILWGNRFDMMLVLSSVEAIIGKVPAARALWHRRAFRNGAFLECSVGVKYFPA